MQIPAFNNVYERKKCQIYVIFLHVQYKQILLFFLHKQGKWTCVLECSIDTKFRIVSLAVYSPSQRNLTTGLKKQATSTSKKREVKAKSATDSESDENNDTVVHSEDIELSTRDSESCDKTIQRKQKIVHQKQQNIKKKSVKRKFNQKDNSSNGAGQ